MILPSAGSTEADKGSSALALGSNISSLVSFIIEISLNSLDLLALSIK